MMRIQFTKTAEKQFKKIDASVQEFLIQKICQVKNE